MRVAFPYVNMTEAVPFIMDIAPGMFAWRQTSAKMLMTPSDMGGGDLTAEQRRDALVRFVELHRPLTALTLFWSIAALEDLFRDMGTQLNAVPELDKSFPSLTKIAPAHLPNPAPDKRPDQDPLPYLDFARLNQRNQYVFGIDAVDPADIARLHDLALIRHTIAHHGGLVRQIDLPRFRYYQMEARRIINPPVSFVLETVDFVYGVGSSYLANLRQRIFDVVLPTFSAFDPASPPVLVVQLIEAFHYFGKIPRWQPQPLPLLLQSGPLTPEAIRLSGEAASKAAREDLLQQCLAMFPATR